MGLACCDTLESGRTAGFWQTVRAEDWSVEECGADADLTDAQAARQGDEHAFARLVKRYQAVIFRQMWRFTRDPMVQEELVQQVFVEVFRSLGGFKGHAPFEHWLRRIATRVGYRYWKHEARERKRREVLLQQPLPSFTTQPENAGPEEAAALLFTLLERLNPKDRLVLTLMYFEECDGAEIAARTGWSSVLVRVQAHRARQRLKALLEGAGLGNLKERRAEA